MEITKEQFEAYEEVRVSGAINMMMVSTISDLSGLDKPQIMEIMKRYSELSKQYLN